MTGVSPFSSIHPFHPVCLYHHSLMGNSILDWSIGETVLYVNEVVIDSDMSTVIQELEEYMSAEKWHGNRSEGQI